MKSFSLFLTHLFLLLFCNQLIAQESEPTIPLYKFENIRSLQFKDTATGYYVSDTTFVYHGPYTQYFRDKPHVEGYYEHGVRNGFWKKSFENGKLCIKGMYANGKAHGVWKYYYDTDTLASTIYYNQGQVVGVATEYDFDGSKRAEWRINNTGFFERVTYFHPNGNVAMDDSIRIESNDTIVKRLLYFKNGNVYQKSTVVNGVVTGDVFTYYESGTPWEHAYYSGGLVQKIHYTFDRKGKEKVFQDLKNGVLIRLYHANEDLYCEVTAGTGDTLNYAYYDFGKWPSVKGAVHNSKPVGTWVYTDHGKVMARITFLDGYNHYIISPTETGMLKAEEREYFYGKRQGSVEVIDIYKTKIKVANYEKGYLSGPFYQRNGDGVEITGNFDKNNCSGTWVKSKPMAGSKPDSVIYNGIFTVDTSSSYFKVSKPSLTGNRITNFGYSYVYADWYRYNSAMNSFNNDHARSYGQILQNIEKPLIAEENNVKGEVIIDYVVGPMGELTDFKVVQGIGYGCEEEVIRALNSFPYLRPSRVSDLAIKSKKGFIHYFE